jgi:hypothetical protein
MKQILYASLLILISGCSQHNPSSYIKPILNLNKPEPVSLDPLTIVTKDGMYCFSKNDLMSLDRNNLKIQNKFEEYNYTLEQYKDYYEKKR